MGYKAGYETIIPLTPKCHQKVHAKGWSAIGLNQGEAIAIAKQVQRIWEKRNQAQNSGER